MFPFSGAFAALTAALNANTAARSANTVVQIGSRSTAPLPMPDDPSVQEQMDRAAERKAAHELIELLAQEAEPAAFARADEFYAQALAEYERDRAGYKFECRRWGGFLALMVERPASLGWYRSPSETGPNTYSGSVNLKETREIRFIAGHEPDRNGVLRYDLRLVDERYGPYWSSGMGNYLPREGDRYEVHPNYFDMQPQRMLVVAEPPTLRRDDSAIWYCGGTYRPLFTTKNWPRAAEDDVIVFEGTGMTLHAPAGMGLAVYQAILEVT